MNKTLEDLSPLFSEMIKAAGFASSSSPLRFLGSWPPASDETMLYMTNQLMETHLFFSFLWAFLEHFALNPLDSYSTWKHGCCGLTLAFVSVPLNSFVVHNT